MKAAASRERGRQRPMKPRGGAQGGVAEAEVKVEAEAKAATFDGDGDATVRMLGEGSPTGEVRSTGDDRVHSRTRTRR